MQLGDRGVGEGVKLEEGGRGRDQAQLRDSGGISGSCERERKICRAGGGGGE